MTDVAAGPTDDVVAASFYVDDAGEELDIRRYDAAGALVTDFIDGPHAFVPTYRTTSDTISINAQNEVAFASVDWGYIVPSWTVDMTVSRVDRCGHPLFVAQEQQHYQGINPVGIFWIPLVYTDTAGEAFASVPNGTLFTPGLHHYSSTGSLLGEITTNATPGPDGFLYNSSWVAGGAAVDFGCGSLTAPASGALGLVKLDASGTCVWSKLYPVPASTVTTPTFSVGADNSLAVAFHYTGTMDLGSGPMTGSGNASIALARFDASGNLIFAKTVGSAGSNFGSFNVRVGYTGITALYGGYTGAGDLGGGPLSTTDDTYIAAFDAAGTLRWTKTVTVGSTGALKLAVGTCGLFVATTSPTVDLGTGPLMSAGSNMGVAGLAL
jgi:hypothetical protein